MINGFIYCCLFIYGKWKNRERRIWGKGMGVALIAWKYKYIHLPLLLVILIFTPPKIVIFLLLHNLPLNGSSKSMFIFYILIFSFITNILNNK